MIIRLAHKNASICILPGRFTLPGRLLFAEARIYAIGVVVFPSCLGSKIKLVVLSDAVVNGMIRVFALIKGKTLPP